MQEVHVPTWNARRRSDRRGFTLVELMVASVIAIIVIMAIFRLFSFTSNVFFSQNQLVDAQSNARFALNLISSEMSRAGHLGTPSVTQDTLVCPTPSVTGLQPEQLVPIRIVDDGSAGEVFAGGGGAAANSNILPDELWLIGAFEVSQAIPVQGFSGQTITLDEVALGTLLNLPVPIASSNAALARYAAVFTPGRLLRVAAPDGSMQIVTIQSSNGASSDPTVTVDQLTYSGAAVSGGGTTACGIVGIDGEGYEVSVLNIYRYSVRADTFNDAKMDLVRDEIDAASGNVLTDVSGNALGPVPILEYVVDFQAWVDCSSGSVALPLVDLDTVPGDDTGNMGFVNCSDNDGTAPQNQAARAAHISITARTAREDTTIVHERRTDASERAPIITFNADNNVTASAQVVTVGTQVELHNLTLRNLPMPGN